jgi:hypothetical protein
MTIRRRVVVVVVDHFNLHALTALVLAAPTSLLYHLLVVLLVECLLEDSYYRMAMLSLLS